LDDLMGGKKCRIIEKNFLLPSCRFTEKILRMRVIRRGNIAIPLKGVV